MTEIDWETVADRDWSPCNYEDGKILVLPEELMLSRRSASGSEAREGGCREIRMRYHKKFAHRGMSMKYARLLWRRYLADDTDLKIVPPLEEQRALNRPASPITNAERPMLQLNLRSQLLRYRNMKKAGQWAIWLK